MNQEIAKFRIKGLTAAPFTPFKDNGDLNLDIIDDYIDHLVHDHVYNVFICGTSGEGQSMTVPERKLLAEKWLNAGRNKLKSIIVHVGAGNLRETQELARHAEKMGASAISLIPPTFFKPNCLEALVKYIKEVANQAPTLPLYYYHLPHMSGAHFVMAKLLDEISKSQIQSFRGIKFSLSDLLDFGLCSTHSGEQYDLLYGNDETLLSSLPVSSSKGAIGSTYNYAGRVYNNLLTYYEKGDMESAIKEQRRSQKMVQLLKKYGGGIEPNKVFMKLAGIDVGPPRLPLLPLTNQEEENLKHDLQDIGFFDWIVSPIQ